MIDGLPLVMVIRRQEVGLAVAIRLIVDWLVIDKFSLMVGDENFSHFVMEISMWRMDWLLQSG